MWNDLQALHSLGIFVRDTHGGNYLGGKLIDFSRSWTMYHPALDKIQPTALRDLRLGELQNLLEYYYDWAHSTSPPSPKIAIPQDLESFCSGQIARYRKLPMAYDWLKFKKKEDKLGLLAYVKDKVFESEGN
jgi:hypothetical protein